jgi:cytochrome c556
MLRIGGAVAVLAIGISVAMAQQDGATARRDLMRAQGRSMYGVLSQMVRGAKPYDQAAVDAALAQLMESAKQMPGVFLDTAKADAPGGDYTTSSKVWDNKADFDGKIAALGQSLAASKDKIKDLDSLKAAYPALSGHCNSCHETYRIKTN